MFALGLATIAGARAQNIFTLHTPAAGDAGYSWNSRYAGDAYEGVNALTLECSTSFYSGSPSDTQYAVGIFMIPISPLVSGTLFNATLHVASGGFSDWCYTYPATASIGWLDTGNMVLTGDVVADGLGPAAKARPGGMTIYNSGDTATYSGAPGPLSFDVTAYVQADLIAGRSYSTFVLSASRDTAGSLHAAESGMGPYLVASSSAIPEPSAYALLAGLGAIGLSLVFRRKLAG